MSTQALPINAKLLTIHPSFIKHYTTAHLLRRAQARNAHMALHEAERRERQNTQTQRVICRYTC